MAAGCSFGCSWLGAFIKPKVDQMSDTRDKLKRLKAIVDNTIREHGAGEKIEWVAAEVFECLVNSIDELYQEIEVLKTQVRKT